MLRGALLRLSRSHKIKDLVTTAPVTSRVVERFIAGETSDRAVAVTRRLIGSGLLATIDYLGEDTTERGQADTVVVAYLDLLTKLRESGLSSSAEVSIKVSALGLHLRDGPQLALQNAELICHAARMADTAVTLDMEDHTTTTRLWRSCVRCARSTPGLALCCRHICTAPTATAGISQRRDRGFGSARARTRSRRAWHFKIGRRSTSHMYAA